MLDHVSIGITDRNKSTAFYDAVLPTIGLMKVADYGEIVAYGPSRDNPFFWLSEQPGANNSQGFH